MQADKASSTEHRWFCNVLYDKKGVQMCSDDFRLPESVCSMMVPCMILPYLFWRFTDSLFRPVLGPKIRGVRDGRGPEEPRGAAMHRTPRCSLRGDLAVLTSKRDRGIDLQSDMNRYIYIYDVNI